MNVLHWLQILAVVLFLFIPAPAVRAESGLAAAPGRQMLAYYVPYDPNSWYSLERHASEIDIVAAQWVTIDACGRLSSSDNLTLKQFAQERGIQVFPTLLTSSGWLNHSLLSDPEVAARAVGQIADYVTAEGYDGFDLDLEGVLPEDRDAYSAFVASLGATLHDRGKALALAIPAKTNDSTSGWAGAFDYAALGQHADLITIMAYEFHGSWGGPGAVAPYDWVEQVTAYSTSRIPAEKVLLALGFYGYDWNTTSGSARYMGFPEVTALAAREGATLSQDPVTRSTTFQYEALGSARPASVPRLPAPDHRIIERVAPACDRSDPSPRPAPRPAPAPTVLQQHEVWIETAANGAERINLASRYGTAGIAAWCLGLEDPQIWDVLKRWRRGESAANHRRV